MDINRATGVFPNFFKNFELPKGAKGQNIEVYRFCFWGKVDRQAFYGSYETQMRGLISLRSFGENSNDPGDYSTSCFENFKDVKKMKNMFTRHHPKAIVAKGITEKSCGLCQRTKERESDCKNSHVDWWIYENANPQDYFKEV